MFIDVQFQTESKSSKLHIQYKWAHSVNASSLKLLQDMGRTSGHNTCTFCPNVMLRCSSSSSSSSSSSCSSNVRSFRFRKTAYPRFCRIFGEPQNMLLCAIEVNVGVLSAYGSCTILSWLEHKHATRSSEWAPSGPPLDIVGRVQSLAVGLRCSCHSRMRMCGPG